MVALICEQKKKPEEKNVKIGKTTTKIFEFNCVLLWLLQEFLFFFIIFWYLNDISDVAETEKYEIKLSKIRLYGNMNCR